MKKFAAVLLLLTSANVSAWCDHHNQIGEIPYKINSSYFGQKSAKQLDAIVDAAQSKSTDGYLILEYQLNTKEIDNINDPKAKQERRKYNRWLADRRIKRVKDYLQAKQVNSPILSRLRTTANKASRSVTVHECTSDSHSSTFKANAE